MTYKHPGHRFVPCGDSECNLCARCGVKAADHELEVREDGAALGDLRLEAERSSESDVALHRQERSEAAPGVSYATEEPE